MKNITVIYHSADFDGIFCMQIARKFLGDTAEYIGWDHGNPKLPRPRPDSTVYVLDLSPDCFEGVPEDPREMGSEVIWIDHHKSSIEKWNPDITGYRIDGVAACRLAWQWFASGKHLYHTTGSVSAMPLPKKDEFFHCVLQEPRAVRLAGEYDVWDKRDPDAEVFQFGLRSKQLTEEDWKYLLLMADGNLRSELDLMKTNLVVDRLLMDGRLLQRYQQGVDAGVVKRGFTVMFEGLTFLALNTARCNSLTFEAGVMPEHDALMGFYCDGVKWKISLYHAPGREHHDLSKIAVKYGGGGHRGACGFHARQLGAIPGLPGTPPALWVPDDNPS